MTPPTLAPATAQPTATLPGRQRAATPPAGSNPLTGRRGRARAGGVRRVPTPTVAPPFDDEVADVDPAGSARSLRGPSGGLPGQLPFPPPSAAVPRLRVVSAAAQAGPDAGLVPPAAWSARFVRVLLEALAGLRPLAQLGAWANPDVCRGVSRRVGATDRCRDLPRTIGSLRSLHVSTPAIGVAEVCAVVETGHRIRALALRVEAAEGQWRCTDLTIG